VKSLRFDEQVVPLDDRHRLRFLRGDFGVRVLVNDRWWMPDEPFRFGFNRSAAEFDTVENAVRSVQEAFGFRRFFWMDEDERAVRMDTPRQFIRNVKASLRLGNRRQSGPSPRQKR
jgi:hypothetical protein